VRKENRVWFRWSDQTVKRSRGLYLKTLLLQFFSAFVGGLIVYVFGIRKLAIEQRNAFIQKQMSEFYSPIAGYRKRIRAKSEVRKKICSIAGETWRETCAPYSEAKQPMWNHEEQFAPYKKITEYDNKQLREELMPLYRKMLDLFTEKYWLADEGTRAYYQEFLEFVEIWERYLAETLPTDVLLKIEHSEEKVFPFYERVEQILSELHEEINTKNFWNVHL
jgi:hypothetical protein